MLHVIYVNCQQNFDRTNSYQYAALCTDEPQHVWTALTSQITSFFSVWNAKFRAEKYGQTLVQMITHTYSPSSLTEEFFFLQKERKFFMSFHFLVQCHFIHKEKKDSSVLISDHNWINFFHKRYDILYIM